MKKNIITEAKTIIENHKSTIKKIRTKHLDSVNQLISDRYSKVYVAKGYSLFFFYKAKNDSSRLNQRKYRIKIVKLYNIRLNFIESDK